MTTRILTVVGAMMIALSSMCFAHVSGGSICGLTNTDDGQKIIIYTCEGYSVASVIEFRVDAQLENHDVIEALNGNYLTEIGRIRIKDMHNGSSQNIIHIEGVNLTEKEALRWLANGGAFE